MANEQPTAFTGPTLVISERVKELKAAIKAKLDEKKA